MADVHVPAEKQSVGELLGQLSEDLNLLLRQEMELAKAEMNQTLGETTRDLISLAAGGAVAYAGLLALAAAAIAVLAGPVGLPIWLSALIIGVVVGLIGLALVKHGMSGMKHPPLPRRTVASLKNDVRWAKEQIR